MSQSDKKGGIKSPDSSEDSVYVNCVESLEEDFGKLYTTEAPDVKFKVGKEIIPAHKLVVRARSEALKHIIETNDKSEIIDIGNKVNNPTAFFLYLQYLYTGYIKIEKKQSSHVEFADLLELAKSFGETRLERKLIDVSSNFVTIDNVLKMLKTARSNDVPTLLETCIDFIDKHAPKLVKHPSLLTLAPKELKRIIARDSFVANEEDILKMVLKYIETNPKISQQDIRSIVDEIRLSLIKPNDLNTILSKLKEDIRTKVQGAIALRRDPTKKEVIFHRFQTIANVDLATPQNNCKVVSKYDDVDIEEYFSKVPETEHERRNLKIKFQRPSLLNHIRIDFGSFRCHWKQAKPGAFTYHIGASLSTYSELVTLVDYTQCECRGTQTLYFKPTVVKYLKITINSVSIPRCYIKKLVESHYIKNISCSYKTSHTVKYDEDYVVPINLEVCNKGRYFVIEERLITLRSEVTKLRIDYCQPFMVNTLKITCDESEDWSYIDEVLFSVNFKIWQSVYAGKEQGKTKFPLIVKFTKQPVVYIRINGLFPYEEDDGLQSTRMAALSNRLTADIMYL